MTEIKPGLNYEISTLVEKSLCTEHLGSKIGPVLSTPHLCGLFEDTCIMALSPILNEEQNSVGMEISVKHLAPTPIGLNIKVKVELIKYEHPFLTWKLYAEDNIQKIAEGTHIRALINIDKFESKIAQKKNI